MSSDRTWTLAHDARLPNGIYAHGPTLETGESLSVVEEGRLREAEAENAELRKIIAAYDSPGALGEVFAAFAESWVPKRWLSEDNERALAYAERLQEIANFTVPEEDSDCRLDLEDAIDRARGVLEKGDTG